MSVYAPKRGEDGQRKPFIDLHDVSRFRPKGGFIDKLKTTTQAFKEQPESFNELLENKYHNDFVD